jgi:hypothetical protein
MKTCLKETGWEIVDESGSEQGQVAESRKHSKSIQAKTGMGAINYKKPLKLFQ